MPHSEVPDRQTAAVVMYGSDDDFGRSSEFLVIFFSRGTKNNTDVTSPDGRHI
jgi:hypothetical protein